VHPFDVLLKGRQGYIALRFKVDSSSRIEGEVQLPPALFRKVREKEGV
jgi:hypothetical protein